jgi:hypothetical protein
VSEVSCWTKGGPVLDQAGDVARDLLRHLAGGLVQVLDHRRVHRHEGGDAVDRHSAVAGGARHVRVDLGDDRGRRQSGGLGDVD